MLVYAEGVNGAPLRNTALALIERLPPDQTFVPVQALGELFRVLVGKAQWEPTKAHQCLLDWHAAFALIETSPSILFAACELSVRHDLSIWDAVILSAASAAGCRLLLSEDMQTGFTWSGVTVVNPFEEPRHELLAALFTP